MLQVKDNVTRFLKELQLDYLVSLAIVSPCLRDPCASAERWPSRLAPLLQGRSPSQVSPCFGTSLTVLVAICRIAF